MQMSAYVIARVEVTDWDKYGEYMKVTPGVIAQYGGRFIARGGEMVTLEGSEETQRLVLLEFPSMAGAKAWYHSQEYQNARKIRVGAAKASFIAIDGVEANQ
jgi:uncharacterized protein (DUF1330 family)